MNVERRLRAPALIALLVLSLSLLASGETSLITDRETVAIPEGATARLGVRLSAQPLAITRIRVSWLSGDSDISIDGNAVLTFDSTDWNEFQYIRLSAAPDKDHENGTAIIRVHRIAGDPVPYKDIEAIESEPPGDCVNLPTGWNLISLPLEPTDPDPEAVFDEVSPLPLYSYNGTSYDSFASKRLTEVSPLVGYWIYLDASTKICAEGSRLTGAQSAYLEHVGWHMVGVPYPVQWGSGGSSSGPPPLPPGVRRVITTSGGGITVSDGYTVISLTEAVSAGWIEGTVWEWDPGARIYTETPLAVGKALQPWHGYWILTYREGLTLRFSETPVTGPPPGELPPPPPDRLLFTMHREFHPPVPPRLTIPEDSSPSLAFFNSPNPVTDVNTTVFEVMGEGAESVSAIRVEIYDLSGRLVYSTGEIAGRKVEWHTEDINGELLANGVYLYRMYAKVAGRWVASEIRKLAILR